MKISFKAVTNVCQQMVNASDEWQALLLEGDMYGYGMNLYVTRLVTLNLGNHWIPEFNIEFGKFPNSMKFLLNLGNSQIQWWFYWIQEFNDQIIEFGNRINLIKIFILN